MLDCDKLKNQISDYLDGEIPLTQRKDIDSHLSNCGNCDELIRQMKIIQQSLRQMPQVNSSPEFERKLHEQIFNASVKPSFIPPTFQNWKLPAMGSAIVFATIALFMVFDGTQDTNPPVPSSIKTSSTASTQIGGTNRGTETPVSSPNSQIPQKDLAGVSPADSIKTDSSANRTPFQGGDVQLIKGK